MLTNPNVTALSDGGFLVTWTAAYGPLYNNDEIVGQIQEVLAEIAEVVSKWMKAGRLAKQSARPRT